MNRRDLIKAFAAPAPLTRGRPRLGRAGEPMHGCWSCSCAAPMTPPMSSSRSAATSTTHRGRPSRIAKPDAGIRTPPCRWTPTGACIRRCGTASIRSGQGQVAFVPFAGTDDLTRSHFETQDTIELGQPAGGSRDYRSGFMSRLAAALDARQADRLHRPAAADLPRQVAGAEHRRSTDVGQARRRRSPGQADQGHVRAERPGVLGVGRLSSSRRRLSLDLGGDDRGQSRRGLAAGLRTVGAPHRPADARAVQPRLCRRRRLGHPRQPGRAPPAISPIASASSAARSPASPKRSARRDGAIPWWS